MSFYCLQKNCIYCLGKKKIRRKKHHWNTNEMNLCKLQLNMPHKISLYYILEQNCAGGKGFDNL